MHLICPYCQKQIETAQASGVLEITCPPCGARFWFDVAAMSAWNALEVPHPAGRWTRAYGWLRARPLVLVMAVALVLGLIVRESIEARLPRAPVVKHAHSTPVVHMAHLFQRPNIGRGAPIIALRDAANAARLLLLGIGVDAYVAEHKKLPPRAIYSKDGKPLLSWRVALLPYVGEYHLYKQFKLDEAWDGPHNRELIERMPPVYSQPRVRSPSHTAFAVFTGPGTAFEFVDGLPLKEIKDGPANTMIVGVMMMNTVPWSKPEDVYIAPDQRLPGLSNAALFGDGTVRLFSLGIDDDSRRALITRNGGESSVQGDMLNRLPANMAVGTLLQFSQQIVAEAAASPEQYRWALRLADRALKLEPNEGAALAVYGAANYRVGRFQEAVRALTRADQLNSVQFDGSLPADLAFLAMANHRLAKKDAAQALLKKMRERMRAAPQVDDRDRSFLREAERLIEGSQVSSR